MYLEAVASELFNSTCIFKQIYESLCCAKSLRHFDRPSIALMMNTRRVNPPRAVPDSRRDPRDNHLLNLRV